MQGLPYALTGTLPVGAGQNTCQEAYGQLVEWVRLAASRRMELSFYGGTRQTVLLGGMCGVSLVAWGFDHAGGVCPERPHF